MSCEETSDLLAGYALNALSAADTAAVERHLETCQRHEAELRELREGATAVALTVPEREPPSELRARLLAAFESEASARADAPAPLLRARGRALLAWRPAPAFAYAAAAVLVVAVAGLLVWNITLQTGGGASERLVQEFSGDVGEGKLVYLRDERAGIIELDLQAPPAQRTYQAWAIYGELPVSLGVVPTAGVAAFQADLGDASAVAISIEPAGGSAAPTTDPVLVAALD